MEIIWAADLIAILKRRLDDFPLLKLIWQTDVLDGLLENEEINSLVRRFESSCLPLIKF